MSVPLPAFRRVRLTQQCVIHPQDKGGNYLPCASENWVLFVSLAADGEKIILRTEHLCLPIKPGGALLLPPNVCHELPFVQAPCLMLGFSAADDGQAVFEFPQLQGTPAWMFLLLLYSEQTTATARTPLLDALLMQMAPMAHGFELCAPNAAFSLATEVLQHLNLCFAEELSLTELTNRFHVSTSHMIHMFKAQFGLPPIQYMVRRRIGEAQHLLRTTEDSAGDIAGRVGMINRNYFYRMFKRLVGVSPVRYREVSGERPDMLAGGNDFTGSSRTRWRSGLRSTLPCWRCSQPRMSVKYLGLRQAFWYPGKFYLVHYCYLHKTQPLVSGSDPVSVV